MGRIPRVFLAGVALAMCTASVGCGKPAFPKELFTIRADGADYPFMLSEVSGQKGGRAIHAESGTSASYSQSSYNTGYSTVTVTRSSASQSELSAAVKLAAQVRRADKWLSLDSAVITATDFATYGASSNERTLIIDATAHK